MPSIEPSTLWPKLLVVINGGLEALISEGNSFSGWVISYCALNLQVDGQHFSYGMGREARPSYPI